ncbi:MerR family transcriptional regulator [candidate division WWE3 bacterium]|nr:MerR family transcriptional regulator [candidate division WWE3 bacterium]
MKTHYVCKIIGVSKSTLLRWEKEKLIPEASKNLAGGRVFDAKDVEAILRQLTPKQKELAKKALENQMRSLVDNMTEEIVILAKLIASIN